MQQSAQKVIALYSGGLASTVLLYLLQSKGTEVVPLILDYGQPNSKELDVADGFCKRLELEPLHLENMSALERLRIAESEDAPARIANFEMLSLSLIDVEKFSRVERVLEAKGVIEPVNK